jgi:hypothetical protein
MRKLKLAAIALAAAGGLWAGTTPMATTSAMLWDGSRYHDVPSPGLALLAMAVQVAAVLSAARLGTATARRGGARLTGTLIGYAIGLAILLGILPLSGSAAETLMTIDRPIGTTFFLVAGVAAWLLTERWVAPARCRDLADEAPFALAILALA